MKRIKMLLTRAIYIILAGCGPSIKGDLYLNKTPLLKMEEFFNGEVEGWGVVQDRSGNVTRSFKVKMKGEFSEDGGKIFEQFYFSDGEESTRTWIVKKNAEGIYEGKADDILDGAHGKTYGNALNWHYEMDLKVEGETYRVKFDDWMWQLDQQVVFNRSYIKKFGLVMGELSLFMKKNN